MGSAPPPPSSPPGEEAAPALRPATPADTIRAVSVVFGGSAALGALAGVATLSAFRALLRGRVPGTPTLLGLAGIGLYAFRAVPWMRRWGATGEELRAPLPGDDLVPDPAIVSTRAITIDAPVAEVWPWLAQLGQDRGGFYSYEWLENLAGCEMRNADRIHPEWQRREVGDPVLLHPSNGLAVTLFQPDRALGIEGWGVLVLEPADGGARTRLLVRSRVPRGPAAAFYATLVELPHFVMERRMLLGIRERAEPHERRPEDPGVESGP